MSPLVVPIYAVLEKHWGEVREQVLAFVAMLERRHMEGDGRR